MLRVRMRKCVLRGSWGPRVIGSQNKVLGPRVIGPQNKVLGPIEKDLRSWVLRVGPENKVPGPIIKNSGPRTFLYLPR